MSLSDPSFGAAAEPSRAPSDHVNDQVNQVVARLFEAGLAMSAVQHAAGTEYCRARAAAAVAALDDAVRELRSLAVELTDSTS